MQATRSGWPATAGRYAIRSTPPTAASTPGSSPLEGRSVRKGVASDRDQAADAVSDTLDELPARCRRCNPSPIANCTAARQTAADLHVEVRSVCRPLSSLVGLRRPGDGLGCRYPEHRELGKHSWAARRRAAVLGALGRDHGAGRAEVRSRRPIASMASLRKRCGRRCSAITCSGRAQHLGSQSAPEVRPALADWDRLAGRVAVPLPTPLTTAAHRH